MHRNRCKDSKSYSIGDGQKCVKFNFSRETWEIFFVNKEGKPQQSSKGLNLRMTDAFGQKVSVAEMESDMQDKKIRAIHMWNRMDQSSQPRLQLPSEPR